MIRYEVRQPDERDWQPVTLFRPNEIQIIHQEALSDHYADAEPFAEDTCPTCGAPLCTGACILPPIA